MLREKNNKLGRFYRDLQKKIPASEFKKMNHQMLSSIFQQLMDYANCKERFVRGKNRTESSDNKRTIYVRRTRNRTTSCKVDEINKENAAHIESPTNTMLKTSVPRRHTMPLKMNHTIGNDFKPIVYLKDILTTQGRSNKTEYMNYFGLTNTTTNSAEIYPSTSLGLVKFSHCPNIPFSSEVGKLIASKENHFMPNNSKSKRLDRNERYINKCVPVDNNVNFPVVYRSKNNVYSTRYYKFPGKKFKSIPSSLLSFCRPVSVRLDKQDLYKMKRMLGKLKVKVSVNCADSVTSTSIIYKNLKVIVPYQEKQLVDNYCRRLNTKARKMHKRLPFKLRLD